MGRAVLRGRLAGLGEGAASPPRLTGHRLSLCFPKKVAWRGAPVAGAGELIFASRFTGTKSKEVDCSAFSRRKRRGDRRNRELALSQGNRLAAILPRLLTRNQRLVTGQPKSVTPPFLRAFIRV